ncbi:hypothetical protein HN865_02280 [Candidatus Woesearchaeota archaeon]|jgi:hypothetical protein|nr:hypothetical protein [Candidatus Woesearchaeota archaeon]
MKKKKVDYDIPQNIEELLKSRRRYPIATLELIKDIARRIKLLEKKLEKIKEEIGEELLE